MFVIPIVTGSHKNRLDWVGLPSLAVETIVDHLWDSDVADFMRFRLVCKLWMADSGTEKPHELGEHVIDHHFHPHLWILLTDTYHNMLNMAIRKIIMVDLLELDSHAMVLGLNVAPEGMLVVRERTLVMCLLNPLTRHVVDLQMLRSLQPSSRRGPISNVFHEDHEVTGVH